MVHTNYFVKKNSLNKNPKLYPSFWPEISITESQISSVANNKRFLFILQLCDSFEILKCLNTSYLWHFYKQGIKNCSGTS